MKLQEKHIEDILYNSPWLLDERFIVPSIKGNAGLGRQVNVGRGHPCRDGGWINYRVLEY